MKIVKLKELLEYKQLIKDISVEIKLDESEVYGDMVNLFIREKLDSDFLLKLFSYGLFRLNNSSNCKADFKKLFGNTREDLVFINSLMKRLSSISISASRAGEVGSHTSLTNCCLGYTIKLLTYYIEIHLGNTKFPYISGNYKLKDLPELSEVISTDYMSCIELIVAVMEDRSSEDIAKIPKNRVYDSISRLGFSNVVNHIVKIEVPAIMLLLERLMPEESNFYKNNINVPALVGHLAICEYKHNEFNIELSKDFYKLLKYRKYLLPYNGISISPSRIGMNIDMYERQLDGDNYLIILSKVRCNTGVYFHTIINLTKEYMLNNCGNIYDITNFLYYFYGLENYSDELFGEQYFSNNPLYHSFNLPALPYGEIHNMCGTNKSVYTDYDVCSPYYWKYKESPKSKLSSRDFRNKTEESYSYISAFKRKLPEGAKPSEKALELTKVYNLILQDNETIVSPHVRGYKSSNLFGGN